MSHVLFSAGSILLVIAGVASGFIVVVGVVRRGWGVFDHEPTYWLARYLLAPLGGAALTLFAASVVVSLLA